jgi:hypothetical protein
MIYSSDLVITNNLQEHGKFAIYAGHNQKGKRMEIAQFDTYEEAKEAAIKKGKEYKSVSVYLWGHDELEPEIPTIVYPPVIKDFIRRIE